MPLLLADFIYSRDCKLNLRKNVDTTPKQAAAQKWYKHKKHRSIVTLSGVLPISSPAIWSEWRVELTAS